MAHRHTTWAIPLVTVLSSGVLHAEELLGVVAPPEQSSPSKPAPVSTPAAPPVVAPSPVLTKPAKSPAREAPVMTRGGPDRAEPKRPRLGPFLNSGLHLRMSLGFGTTSDVVGTAETDDDDGDRSTVNGIGAVGEVLLGAPVASDLVFGGGLWVSSMSTASYFYDRGKELPEVMQRPRDFAMVGPYVDWYFARRPGLHVEGGLGFALLTGSGWAHGTDEGNPAFGGGLSAAFGYDTWVADSWKLGLLGRVMAAVLGEREAGDTWVHAVTSFPALLVSATYN